MPRILLQDVSLEYPVYDTESRSFQRSIVRNIPVGGKIRRKQGERTTILALDNISVELNRGDRVALLGHNGAGKTSLLKLIAGFYTPTSGRIRSEGKMSALLNLMAGMDANLSGYDNIMTCLTLHGLSRKEGLQKTEHIAQFSELGSYLDMPIRLYSQGMVLRLAFSICTSIDCEILLLDEWIGAGDQAFILKAKERLTEMIFRSSILVFATHNVDVATQLCNKALYMEHGKILKFDAIEKVMAFQEERLRA